MILNNTRQLIFSLLSFYRKFSPQIIDINQELSVRLY